MNDEQKRWAIFRVGVLVDVSEDFVEQTIGEMQTALRNAGNFTTSTIELLDVQTDPLTKSSDGQ